MRLAIVSNYDFYVVVELAVAACERTLDFSDESSRRTDP